MNLPLTPPLASLAGFIPSDSLSSLLLKRDSEKKVSENLNASENLIEEKLNELLQKSTQKSSKLFNKIFPEKENFVAARDETERAAPSEAVRQRSSIEEINSSLLQNQMGQFTEDYLKTAFPLLTSEQASELREALSPNIEEFSREMVPLFTEFAQMSEPELEQTLATAKTWEMSVQAGALVQVAQSTLTESDQLLQKNEPAEGEFCDFTQMMYHLNLTMTQLFESTLLVSSRINGLLGDQQKKFTEDQIRDMGEVAKRQVKAVKTALLEKIFMGILNFSVGALQVVSGILALGVDPIGGKLLIAAGIADMSCGLGSLIVEAIPMCPKVKGKIQLALGCIQGAFNGLYIGTLALRGAIQLGAKMLVKFACKNIDVTTGKMGVFLYGSHAAAQAAKASKLAAAQGIVTPKAFDQVATLATYVGGGLQAGATTAQTTTGVIANNAQRRLKQMQATLQKSMALLRYITDLTQESIARLQQLSTFWAASVEATMKVPENARKFMCYATDSRAYSV